MNGPGDSIVVERVSQPDPDDLAAIVALEADSFTNPWTPEALTTMLRSDITHLYVVRKQEHEIVGFCACWLIETELHINTLAVSSRYRRQGIATRLVRFVLEATGADKATLEVRRSNLAAIDLYEKLGFQATAVRERYYRNPDDDGLILWLNP
ncbi:MAG: ribosomal protein S18-alanine N-acetyltransferase [Acidobacteria bacterium]|nr:ribosomal protein S18-alanine N-acetyltransferase [Acidobacteriota bacterium]